MHSLQAIAWSMHNMISPIAQVALLLTCIARAVVLFHTEPWAHCPKHAVQTCLNLKRQGETLTWPHCATSALRYGSPYQTFTMFPKCRVPTPSVPRSHIPACRHLTCSEQNFGRRHFVYRYTYHCAGATHIRQVHEKRVGLAHGLCRAASWPRKMGVTKQVHNCDMHLF